MDLNSITVQFFSSPNWLQISISNCLLNIYVFVWQYLLGSDLVSLTHTTLEPTANLLLPPSPRSYSWLVLLPYTPDTGNSPTSPLRSTCEIYPRSYQFRHLNPYSVVWTTYAFVQMRAIASYVVPRLSLLAPLCPQTILNTVDQVIYEYKSDLITPLASSWTQNKMHSFPEATKHLTLSYVPVYCQLLLQNLSCMGRGLIPSPSAYSSTQHSIHSV